MGFEDIFSDIERPWIWLAVGLGLVFLELATGTLYLLWPGVAAILFAGVVYLAPGMGVAAELALFAALAVGLTFLGRSYFKGRNQLAQSDRPTLNQRGAQLVGRRVSALEAFVNGEGPVSLDDSRWRARTADGAPLEVAAGASLTVVTVEGALLIVKPA